LLEPAIIKTSILKIGKNIVSVEGKIFNEKNMLIGFVSSYRVPFRYARNEKITLWESI